MAGARNSTNATPATIAPRWSAETEFGPINRPLTSDGRIVAVAGEGGMTGLDARTGATAWRLAANGLVTDATVTDFGPVLVHQDGLDGRIVALDWKGDILWSEPGRGAMGVDAIRGCGDRLLSAGEIKDPARRLVFRVHDAATGKVVGTYPGEATRPYLSRFGLVYAVHSSDPAHPRLSSQRWRVAAR